MSKLADYTIGVVIVLVHLVMVSVRERKRLAQLGTPPTA
jgi:hypothetical protein